jgi:uncharacterized protein DUF6988
MTQWRLVSSSLIDDLTQRGDELRAQVRQMLKRHQYSTTTKSVMLLAYVDLALEHHAAIWLLRERELFGSAFALVRPLYDIMFRALWIGAKATDEQVEQASRDELNWQRIRLFDEIKEAYFGQQALRDAQLAQAADKFFQDMRNLMKVLHSYTHPGLRQLGRRFTAAYQVKPNYSEADIAQGLNVANDALMFLMLGFFVIIKAKRESDEIRALLRQYYKDFAGRLHAGA